MRVLSCAVLLLVVACDSSETTEVVSTADAPPLAAAASPSPPKTVVWIGGDVLLSGAIRRHARAGGDPAAGFAEILAPVSAHWDADGDDAYVLVNLESPVAEQRHDVDRFDHLREGPGRVPAPLNAPRWLLDGLVAAGVDAVMLANNHALDQEREGLAETIDAAHAAGLVTTGAGRAPNVGWPLVVGTVDAEVAILTYFEKDYPEPELRDGEAGLSVLGPRSAADVRRAARDHDAVIVVVHVVAELLDRVKESWRSWATELAEAGADVIAVHGTHVPAPTEILEADGRRVVVAWGLGNFVSDMGASAAPGQDAPGRGKWAAPEPRESLLMRVEVRPGGIDASFLPLLMHHDRWLVHNRVAALPIRFRLVPVAACGAAADIGAGWPHGAWPEPYAQQMREFVDERRDHLLSIAALSADDCRPGEVTLLRPAAIRGTMAGDVQTLRLP